MQDEKQENYTVIWTVGGPTVNIDPEAAWQMDKP